MARLHGLAIPEVDFQELFAGGDASHHLLGARVDDRSAIGIRIGAVETERDPTGVRLFGGILEERHVGHMARRQLRHIVDVQVAVDAIDEPNFFLVGPDEESDQWVSSVAKAAEAPYVTLRKTRRGDNDVSVDFPEIAQFRGLAPVLIDDIISSGRTMEVAVSQLLAHGLSSPVIVGVHGIFAEDSHQRLLAAGAVQVISTNTVPHSTNAIDLSAMIATTVTKLIAP